MTKRAVIYTRVSKDESGEGASNDRQEERCQALAVSRGWQVVGVENDISISATTGVVRPAWEKVLAMIAAGSIDVILAWQLDRVTRSMDDLIRLVKLANGTGVGLVTASGDIDLTSDAGRMLAKILTSVAEFEGERKSARQQLANRQRATSGIPWPSGFRAFGYKLDGTLIESEASAIRVAAADALSGVSMREIARRWDAAGLKSVHAKDGQVGWTGRGVKSMLVNPRYAGIATYKGERMGAGNWTPILSEHQHLMLRGKLGDVSRRTRSSAGRTPEHLLSGYATCSRCGERVNARSTNGYPAYGCVKGCVGTWRESTDAYVTEVFRRSLRAFGPALVTTAATSEDGDDDALMADLMEDQTRYTNAYTARGLTHEEYAAAMAEIESKMRGLEIKASRQARSYSPTHGVQELIQEFEDGSLETRRTLIQRCLDVSLSPKGRGRRNVPIEDQVNIEIRFGSEVLGLDSLHAMEVPA